MATQLRAFQTLPQNLTLDPLKRIVRSGEQFQQMMNHLSHPSVKALTIDFETSGLEWFKKSRACGLGLGAWDEHGQIHCYYVPFRHQTGEQQLDKAIIDPGLKWLWENPNTTKIAHNIKFEDHMARREGWKLGGKRYDTLVGARLYNENMPVALKDRAVTDLGLAQAKDWDSALDREIVKRGKENKLGKKAYLKKYGYSQVPIDLCGFYGCHDIDFTTRLFWFYEQHKISTYYDRIWQTEMDLTEAICDIEEAGLPIDREYLERLRESLGGVLAGLEDQIFHMLPAGQMFNMGSDDELRRYLIRDLRLPLYKETESGKDYSVDDDVLAEFAPMHPPLQKMRDWRIAKKLSSTYTDSIISRLDDNNVLHGELDQGGTNTGRFASKNPNLQNFPSDDDDRSLAHTGKKIKDGGYDPWSIRRAFVMPRKGYCRVFYDYSQVELRVLAHYTQDPVLVKAYLNGEDIHLRTQTEVFGDPDPLSPKRRFAKILNFGLSYCMSEIGYARNAKIPEHEAKQHMDAFFKRYAGIATFRNTFWNKVRAQRGWFNNMFGRTRRLPEICAMEFWRAKRAERQAIGSLVQGTAAELTKEATVRIHKWIKEEGLPASIVTIIHDDIQVDCPTEMRDYIARGMKKRMEDFPEFAPIPITVDGQYTETNWAEKHSLPH